MVDCYKYTLYIVCLLHSFLYYSFTLIISKTQSPIIIHIKVLEKVTRIVGFFHEKCNQDKNMFLVVESCTDR